MAELPANPFVQPGVGNHGHGHPSQHGVSLGASPQCWGHLLGSKDTGLSPMGAVCLEGRCECTRCCLLEV